MILQDHLSKGIEKYTVIQLNDDEIIYLESKIKLYHEQWKIVIGYDLTNLEKNYDMLSVVYTNFISEMFS